MEYRIGGDFEVSVQQLLGPASNKEGTLNPHKEHVLYVDTGRSAILIALQNILESTSISGAVLPFYCCPTIIAPFRQLGIKIDFYSMGKRLCEPSGLPKDLSNKVILFIHHFGFRNRSMEDYIAARRRDNNDFYVIEDCVQTCASVNFGRCGDYVIHSLRKFLPVPDGGVVASDQPFRVNQLLEPDEAFISGKLLAKLMRDGGGQDDEFLRLYECAEELLDADAIRPRVMSVLSRFIYDKIDLKHVQARRILNWTYLSNAFERGRGRFEGMRPLYTILEQGEVPLVFPITTEGKRDLLRDFLRQKNIFCPVHWHLSEGDEGPAGKVDYDLSRSILSLPIDQRVDEQGVDYLLHHLNQFKRATS